MIKKVSLRYTRPKAPIRLPMDQLSFCFSLLGTYLDPDKEERFWDMIRENCPELASAVESDFYYESKFKGITFTRELYTPFGKKNQEQPEATASTPAQTGQEESP